MGREGACEGGTGLDPHLGRTHNNRKAVILVRFPEVLHVLVRYSSAEDTLEEARVELQTCCAVLYTVRALPHLNMYCR